jgi:glycosyltransferase involved in cell wall biosynthesis
MRVFVLAPREDWICDRLASEWYDNFSQYSTRNLYEADVIWLLAGWCWNHIPVSMLSNKKLIVTEHHIVPEKFTKEKFDNFRTRDQFVDCYHVPNNSTKNFIRQITNKPIKVISYWLNDNLWHPYDKIEARKKLNLNTEMYYVGSFQRDTEGFDLKTPKLEKGPDLFCDYLIRNRSKMKNLHVLLGGWRRQYVENRLNEAKIPYTLFEKSNIEIVKLLYASCDLYIVSSRHEGGPQAIIEAAAMKIPIISTDVGIVRSILSDNCIVDIEKNYYNPIEEDLSYAYERVHDLTIREHGMKFIKLFEDVML